MSRQTPISSVMTTDVLSFAADVTVGDAMAALVERGVDGAPVVDDEGTVLGVISTGDLIVQDAEIHVPTMISMFGASIELPSAHRHFEEDLRRALGSTVADVMATDPVTLDATATIEDAATMMHREKVSRLPIVEDGHLVGIVARTDIIRSMIRDDDAADADG